MSRLIRYVNGHLVVQIPEECKVPCWAMLMMLLLLVLMPI